MVTFHYIEFKTYCHATEDKEKVRSALFNIIGQEIELEENEAEGYYGNPILIMSGKIDINTEMDDFLSRLNDDIIEELLMTLENRIDERCNFYFRLDKEKAYDEELKLSSGSNTIKVRARVESYPAKRDNAIKKMREYLQEKK